MEPLQQFGISLIQALQTLSPSLDGLMKFFTFLGRIEFYLLIIPFVYWTIDKRLGMRQGWHSSFSSINRVPIGLEESSHWQKNRRTEFHPRTPATHLRSEDTWHAA